MIIPVSRHNLEIVYDYADALVRALDRTSLSASWDLDALVNHLVNYQAYAFVQPESGYIAVFMITQSPLQKTLYMFWCGKKPDNETPIDYQEVTSAMDEIARHFGCNQILVEGRKGWEKVSKPYGFVEDSRTYSKEVSYELPTIQPTASDGSESGPCGSGEQPLQGRQDVEDELDPNLNPDADRPV